MLYKTGKHVDEEPQSQDLTLSGSLTTSVPLSTIQSSEPSDGPMHVESQQEEEYQLVPPSSEHPATLEEPWHLTNHSFPPVSHAYSEIYPSGSSTTPYIGGPMYYHSYSALYTSSWDDSESGPDNMFADFDPRGAYDTSNVEHDIRPAAPSAPVVSDVQLTDGTEGSLSEVAVITASSKPASEPESESQDTVVPPLGERPAEYTVSAYLPTSPIIYRLCDNPSTARTLIHHLQLSKTTTLSSRIEWLVRPAVPNAHRMFIRYDEGHPEFYHLLLRWGAVVVNRHSGADSIPVASVICEVHDFFNIPIDCVEFETFSVLDKNMLLASRYQRLGRDPSGSQDVLRLDALYGCYHVARFMISWSGPNTAVLNMKLKYLPN